VADDGVIKEGRRTVAGRIGMDGNYADDCGEGRGVELRIDGPVKAALGRLVEVLDGADGPEDMQNAVYEAARENGVAPRDFFRVLYQIILGTDRGPKIGPFIQDIGPDRAGQMIRAHLG